LTDTRTPAETRAYISCIFKC